MVLEKQVINFVNVFLLFSNYMPLEKGKALHMNKNESPLPKYALCQVWLALEKKFFFKISSMYFRYFVIISPWKRTGYFILTNMTLIYPRMICTKFG